MAELLSITCPVCGMTSHNENDVREGYCGKCHGWTSGPLRMACPACGQPVIHRMDGAESACSDAGCLYGHGGLFPRHPASFQ
jgi:ribosomal protein S27AE